MSPTEIGGLLTMAAAAGAAVYRVVDRVMLHSSDKASADKVRAEAKKTAQETAASEVNVLREIIGEVRQSEAAKSARIDALEQRLDLLEERERHMLTRAAVHEAWDQLAFQALLVQNPHHPPPPPLALTRNDDDTPSPS